jgi:8-amino-7-oxononanoate synthase
MDCSIATPGMNGLDADLRHQLDELREQGLDRELRRVDSPPGERIVLDGKSLLNFSSNDYLGLANHPALKTAAIEAVNRYGAGAAASRLICGSLRPHHELEESIAAFKGSPAALSFANGYMAALGTICALLAKDDLLIIDRLVHACIVDAARLCGAKLRVFRHNDLNDLESILKWAQRASQPPQNKILPGKRRVLIVTESLFSMDGTVAPLREIADLKEKYGCWLMVDEAHATGLYGANRRGLAEELGVSSRIEIQMGTLGKAAGASGGYICGSRALIQYLVNRARTFVFSTAPVPAAAAAATAGIKLIQSAEGRDRCETFWKRVSEVKAIFDNARPKRPSPVLPIVLGAAKKTTETAAALRERGIFVPAIRYPTVARGQARLRLTVTANHDAPAIQTLRQAWSAITATGR